MAAKARKKKADSVTCEELLELALGSMSRNAIERLVALEDAWELGARTGSKRAKTVSRLIARAMITDPYVAARFEAADILGDLGTASDQRALKGALSDEGATVRAVAVSCYASIAGKMAVPAVRAALDDRNEVVRKYAAVALYELIGQAAEEEIRSRLETERWLNAKIGMLSVLAHLGDEEALTVLEELRKHELASIRSAAEHALEDIPGQKEETVGDQGDEK